jgi:hypothetical protein
MVLRLASNTSSPFHDSPSDELQITGIDLAFTSRALISTDSFLRRGRNSRCRTRTHKAAIRRITAWSNQNSAHRRS